MTESDPYVLTEYRMEQAHAALEEADILFSQGKTTLGSVNRSYYAMFYAVIALLQRIGKVPRKHSGALALFPTPSPRIRITPSLGLPNRIAYQS